jgi:hypothetical protein
VFPICPLQKKAAVHEWKSNLQSFKSYYLLHQQDEHWPTGKEHELKEQ